MTNALFTEILLWGLAAMLLAAAVWDLRTRTIPNPLNLAIAIAAPLFWWVAGIEFWPDAAMRVGAALAVFLAFYALFCFGGIGGGDVKMAGAVALWFGPMTTLKFFILTAMIGGVVSIATYVDHKRRLARGSAQGAAEVPYGVAIASAAMWLLAQRFLNHFA